MQFAPPILYGAASPRLEFPAEVVRRRDPSPAPSSIYTTQPRLKEGQTLPHNYGRRRRQRYANANFLDSVVEMSPADEDEGAYTPFYQRGGCSFHVLSLEGGDGDEGDDAPAPARRPRAARRASSSPAPSGVSLRLWENLAPQSRELLRRHAASAELPRAEAAFRSYLLQACAAWSAPDADLARGGRRGRGRRAKAAAAKRVGGEGAPPPLTLVAPRHHVSEVMRSAAAFYCMRASSAKLRAAEAAEVVEAAAGGSDGRAVVAALVPPRTETAVARLREASSVSLCELLQRLPSAQQRDASSDDDWVVV